MLPVVFCDPTRAGCAGAAYGGDAGEAALDAANAIEHRVAAARGAIAEMSDEATVSKH